MADQPAYFKITSFNPGSMPGEAAREYWRVRNLLTNEIRVFYDKEQMEKGLKNWEYSHMRGDFFVHSFPVED